MSVLEFIAALKWPIVVLVGMAFASRRMRQDPDLTQWIKRWLDKRNVRAAFAGAEVETISAATLDAVAAASAPDAELLQRAANQSHGAVAGPQQLRREAVEELMQRMAGWGWETAFQGYERPPTPRVIWDGDTVRAVVADAPESAGDPSGNLRMWQRNRDQQSGREASPR